MMALRLLDAEGRGLELFDLERFDLDDERVRVLLFASLMHQIDDLPEAASVEISVDGEVTDVILLEHYQLESRPGLEEFAQDLFQSLDDAAPPPQSGVRRASLRNQA